MKKTLFLSLLVISLYFAPFSLASQMTMTAIPPKVDLKADPGQTLQATLKVRNDSANTEIFLIQVEDFVVTDSKGTPIPLSQNISNRYSLRNWIIAPNEVPVDAGETQIINVQIKVPSNALPGGHYAMLTYTPDTNTKAGDLKQTGNVISQRVGTLFYVTVSGPITEKASLTKLYVPKFSEQGPITIEGTVESQSDSHINPKGTITITDPLNRKITDLNLEVGNIFPDTKRDFSATWNQKWGFGRYKANLNLVYGNAGNLIQQTVFFWLFPIRLILYLLLAIVSILVVIIILNKRSKRHQQELEKEVQMLKDELEKTHPQS